LAIEAEKAPDRELKLFDVYQRKPLQGLDFAFVPGDPAHSVESDLFELSFRYGLCNHWLLGRVTRGDPDQLCQPREHVGARSAKRMIDR